MPLSRQEAQAERRDPALSPEQATAIGQYIQELGGGPELPKDGVYTEDLNQNPDALARGGELFRVNCTSCHGFGGAGGALSSGKYAPSLHDASPEHIYAAMLTGPQNMPVFGDNELTPEQKRQIITYITVQLQQDKDPDSGLLPRDSSARARSDSVCRRACGESQPWGSSAIAPKLRKQREPIRQAFGDAYFI